MQDVDPQSSYPPPPETNYTETPVYAAAPPAAAGLSDNAAGAIAYITIIPAILFLVLEPYNRRPFVRFHAFQSIALGVVWFATTLLTVIPILGWLIEIVLFLVLFVAWIMCIIKASQGVRFKLPVIGDMVENMAR